VSKDPEYTQVLYYILELTGVAAAALLLTRYPRLGWVLSLGVAAGPILGYVLSRGPGLPDYTDEIGNWTNQSACSASLSREPAHPCGNDPGECSPTRSVLIAR
jgi:hypothetical protein